MKTLTTGDLSLTLTRLRPSDSGDYTCIITAFGNEQKLRDIQLQVKEPFSVTVEPWFFLVLLILFFGLMGVLIIYVRRLIKEGQEVEVEDGEESVQLPFKTTAHLSGDVRVEWMDHHYNKVHVYQNGSDRPEEQNQVYRDRTEMKKDPLRTGDLSLTLNHLTVRDRGYYTCRVYKDGDLLRGTAVTLKVKGQELEVEEGEESVQLPFKTTAHLSGDVRVEWTDRDRRKVHVYQNGSDRPEEQDQVYRDRTEMKEDPLRTGDLSLTLKHPTVTDRRRYFCTVYKDGHLLKWTKLFLQVKGQDVEVKMVKEGQKSVQLPFKTTPHLSGDIRVEWTDRDTRKVHVYQNGSDRPEEQDQVYRDQTEMKEDPLRTGDLSLTLKHLTVRDRGDYTCRVYKDGHFLRGTTVTLKVKDQEVEVEEGEESVQLPFKTTAHLSADVRVEWMDHHNNKVHVYQNGSDRPEEQNQVYRDRTEMKKDPLRTGDLSLTLNHLTVRDRGYYTCRVYKDGDLLRGTRLSLKVKGQEVEVEEGEESVQLPFKTTAHLSGDVRVEWTRYSRKVHVYQNGSDRPEEQDQVYRDRTEMKKDPLRTGDLSLTLKHLTVRDSGYYTCRVYKDGHLLRGTTVFLRVKERTQVKDETVDIKNRSSSTDPTPLMADQSVGLV